MVLSSLTYPQRIKALALLQVPVFTLRKKKTGHGIVKSETKAEHGGTGFASTGSIQIEKEKTGHGIVKSEQKS